MIWYVYDMNRSGADVVFFYGKDIALQYKIHRAAVTGGNIAVRWCHPESVPCDAKIH